MKIIRKNGILYQGELIDVHQVTVTLQKKEAHEMMDDLFESGSTRLYGTDQDGNAIMIAFVTEE